MNFDIRAIKKLRRQQEAAKFVVPPSDSRSKVGATGLAAWNHLLEELREQVSQPISALPPLGTRVVELLNTCEELRGHVFVGIYPQSGVPLLVPRSVLYDHAYILGGSGSGKTSCGMIPLVEQLSLPLDSKGNSLGDLPPHPVIIIDLKEVPDRGLKAAADRVARARGQGEHCLLFSAKKRVDSLRWDLLTEARKLDGIPEQSGFILNGFGLVYDPVYGEEYFANSMRTALNKVLEKPGIESLTYTRLVELVGQLVSTKQKRKPNLFKGTDTVATSWRDARGLYDKIQSLRHVDKLVTDSTKLQRDALDLERVIEEGQVLYVHLPSTFMPNDSWDIGRMLVFSLMAVNIESIYTGRNGIGGKRRCFLFIDEFQRMGVKNVVQRFEDARALGLTFILAHQTLRSLPKKDGDLAELIFQDTAFRQAFTVEDLGLLETLERLSGLRLHTLGSESQSIGKQRGRSNSTVHADSHTYGGSSNNLGVSGNNWSVGASDSVGQTSSSQAGSNYTFSMREERVPRFDSEHNRKANNLFPSSVVYIRDGGRGSITPTDSIPTHVLNVFMGEEEERTLEELGFLWLPKQTKPQVQDSKAETKPQKKSALPKTRPFPRNDSIKQLLGAAKKALAHELPQDRTLQFFARSNKLSVEEVLGACSELGIAVENASDAVLTVAEFRLLKEQLVN